MQMITRRLVAGWALLGMGISGSAFAAAADCGCGAVTCCNGPQPIRSGRCAGYNRARAWPRMAPAWNCGMCTTREFWSPSACMLRSCLPSIATAVPVIATGKIPMRVCRIGPGTQSIGCTFALHCNHGMRRFAGRNCGLRKLPVYRCARNQLRPG